MNVRNAALAVSAIDAAAWIVVALAMFLSRSDAATRGLDQAAGVAVTALYVATGAPALALALANRAPRLALALSLAFPAAFAVALVVAVVALP
jgi:hypothetical protein